MNTRVQRMFAVMIFLLCPIGTLAAQPQPFVASSQIHTIEKILPAGWKIVERREGAVPTGLINREKGYYLRLEGHVSLYGQELLNGVPNSFVECVESIEIWIMPPDFQPRKPNWFQKGWPFAIIDDFKAIESSNARFKLFTTSTVTPSWPAWGKGVYHALKVVPSGYTFGP